MREAAWSSETINCWAQAADVIHKITTKAHVNLALVAVLFILSRAYDAATSIEWVRLHRQRYTEGS